MRAPNAKRQAAARALVTNRVLTVLILGARRLLSRQLDEQSTDPRHRGKDRLLYRDASNTRVVNEAEDGKDD